MTNLPNKSKLEKARGYQRQYSEFYRHDDELVSDCVDWIIEHHDAINACIELRKKATDMGSAEWHDRDDRIFYEAAANLFAKMGE